MKRYSIGFDGEIVIDACDEKAARARAKQLLHSLRHHTLHVQKLWKVERIGWDIIDCLEDS